MQITCPECKFSREINEQKIPERSVMATCPKCKNKFQFRELPEETFSLEEAPQEHPAPEAKQPEPEVESRDLPPLHDPAEDPGDELWRKIGDMSPPEGESKRIEPASENPQATPEIPLVEVPFERLDQHGFFPGIFATIKRVLFSPHLFFSVMPLGRGIVRPLVFALLILVLHDVLQTGFLQAGMLPEINVGGIAITPPKSESISLFALVIFSPFMRTMVIFIFAGLYHLLLMALRASDGRFEATFRAVAYAYAPSVLAFIPIPHEYAFMIQLTFISIWSMVITVIGLKCLHRTTYIKATLAALTPIIVILAAVVSSVSGTGPMV